MKKRMMALVAATALVGSVSAFAANPFSDVPTTSWAYQAVSQLASEGIVQGYPNGTFQGQKNITRYEMAEMVARMMANEDRANAEQKVMIQKLANEFSSELQNLGVRVNNLENKVGNVKLTGEAKVKYEQDLNKQGKKEDGKFGYEAKLQANAQVGKNTTAVARLVMENQFGENKEGSNNVTFDRLYVQQQFGKDVAVTAGRQNLFLGDGLVYDGMFDGATASANLGPVQVSAGHGYLMEIDGYDYNKMKSPLTTVAQLGVEPAKNLKVNGFYAHVKDPMKHNVYGASLNYNLNKLQVMGSYAKSSVKAKANDKDRAWMAGIGYGNYDQAKAGTASVQVQYFDQGQSSPVLYSTYDQPLNHDYKGYVATVNYAVVDNVGLKAAMSFNNKSQEGVKLDNSYKVELGYRF